MKFGLDTLEVIDTLETAKGRLREAAGTWVSWGYEKTLKEQIETLQSRGFPGDGDGDGELVINETQQTYMEWQRKQIYSLPHLSNLELSKCYVFIPKYHIIHLRKDPSTD